MSFLRIISCQLKDIAGFDDMGLMSSIAYKMTVLLVCSKGTAVKQEVAVKVIKGLSLVLSRVVLRTVYLSLHSLDSFVL